MSLDRLGVTVPLDVPLADHAPVLRRLWDAGYTDFWSAETAGCDAFTPLAHTAAVLPDAHVGTAIASVFARGPALLAMSAAALAEAAPGRFTLGIGASSPVLTTDWNAVPYERPLGRVRDTVRFLRDAFAGDTVDGEYETFSIRRFRLERRPHVPPPVLVAALRPRMLQVAADEADGAVLNWLSSADVTTVRAELRQSSVVAARILVCPSPDTGAVRDTARRLVATYASVPAYAHFHRWLGRGDALADTWAHWAAGDRKAASAAVPDEVVDALVVHGTVPECAERVREYVRAGVGVPVVKLLPLVPGRDLLADAVALGTTLRNGDG